MNDPYTIFPLGDSAATMELGKLMNEELNMKVLAIQSWFKKNNIPGLKDIIVAYSTITISYDPAIVRKNHSSEGTVYEWIQKKLEQAYCESIFQNSEMIGTTRVPICYDEEFGIDLPEVINSTRLTLEEIIELHVSTIYRVYMLGFLPGFAYLGELVPQLFMPRKVNPVTVIAGSVGIVSNQTGIYPLNSPGGWQILGRTPMKLFDKAEDTPVKLKAGDKVQFYSITREEFESYKKE